MNNDLKGGGGWIDGEKNMAELVLERLWLNGVREGVAGKGPGGNLD